MPSNSDNDRLWLALYLVPGLGIRRLHRLLKTFESPARIFQTSPDVLRKHLRFSKVLVSSIERAFDNPWFHREWKTVNKEGISLIHLESDDYPELLKQLYLPPPVLYCRGNLSPPDRLCVGVVGTRNATNYGIDIAIKVAESLASKGITVVSGFARGIDTAAIKSCLNTGGSTISVLGNGLSIVYPKENAPLIEKIQKNGAVISEFPTQIPPRPKNFPRRNRIISGLSLATVIIEAPECSGALITARFAVEQNRELYVIPGNINTPQSIGSNKLIREGAKMILDITDIFKDLNIPVTDSLKNSRKPDDNIACSNDPDDITVNKILKTLSFQQFVHVDEISRLSLTPVQNVLSSLMILELEGKVIQKEFMMFRKV